MARPGVPLRAQRNLHALLVLSFTRVREGQVLDLILGGPHVFAFRDDDVLLPVVFALVSFNAAGLLDELGVGSSALLANTGAGP